MKNLSTRLLKDLRLRWFGDRESKFYGKVKRGRGQCQYGIQPTVATATDIYPITKKLGELINGNEKTIWDEIFNKMVQRYPQVASGAPPTNAPIKYI